MCFQNLADLSVTNSLISLCIAHFKNNILSFETVKRTPVCMVHLGESKLFQLGGNHHLVEKLAEKKDLYPVS